MTRLCVRLEFTFTQLKEMDYLKYTFDLVYLILLEKLVF